MIRLLVACFTTLLLVACAPHPKVDPLAALREPDGSVILKEEFSFVPPAEPWQLLSLEEDDYLIAFFRVCKEVSPCQSAIAYVEEPFGSSQDFLLRQEEFFKRYLWASHVVFEKPTLQKITLRGKDALVATIEGEVPVKHQKVWSKVVFMHRGERVVAFYFNQWRPTDAPFEKAHEEEFDRFIESFRYLKPSVYEAP
jgi:hypothetical protein